MKKAILVCLSAIILSSCATLLSGPKKPVMLSAKQKGTTVLVNGLEKGQTPITLKLKAGDMITFEKEGFEDRTVIVDSKFNTIAILNLFSLLGWGIDAVTGSLKVPNQFTQTIGRKIRNKCFRQFNSTQIFSFKFKS